MVFQTTVKRRGSVTPTFDWIQRTDSRQTVSQILPIPVRTRRFDPLQILLVVALPFDNRGPDEVADRDFRQEQVCSSI
jgi:hypothetical protein